MMLKEPFYYGKPDWLVVSSNWSTLDDPYEKSSPTIPLEVAKIQLGLASYHDAELEVFEIPVAYLNAYLEPDKRQVIRIPVYIAKMILQVDPTARQFVQSDGTLLVEVLSLTSTLVKGGYTQCPVEFR